MQKGFQAKNVRMAPQKVKMKREKDESINKYEGNEV
jgi:hypothetical protein